MTLAACPPATFEEHGPTTLAAHATGADALALPRPVVIVEPRAAFEDEARRVDVTAVGWTPAGTRVTLAVVADAGAASEPAELTYRIGADIMLPLEVGGRYWLRVTAQRGGSGLLVWRAAAEPELVVALAIDRGLADDAVPGLTVLPAPVGDPVYTEVRTSPSGCVSALDHQRLRVRVAATTLDVPPGTWRRIPVGDGAWDLLALDASRATPGIGASDPTRCVTGAHLSWLALRVPAESGATGAGGAAGVRPGP